MIERRSRGERERRKQCSLFFSSSFIHSRLAVSLSLVSETQESGMDEMLQPSSVSSILSSFPVEAKRDKKKKKLFDHQQDLDSLSAADDDCQQRVYPSCCLVKDGQRRKCWHSNTSCCSVGINYKTSLTRFFLLLAVAVTLVASHSAAAKSSPSSPSTSLFSSLSSFSSSSSSLPSAVEEAIQVRSSPSQGTASIILNPSRIRSSLKSLVLDPFLTLASNAFQKDPSAQLSLNLPSSSSSSSSAHHVPSASSASDYEYTDSASEAISKVVPETADSADNGDNAESEGEKAVASAAATDPEVAKLLSQGSSPFYVLEPAPLPGMLQPYPFAAVASSPAVPAGAQLIHPSTYNHFHQQAAAAAMPAAAFHHHQQHAAAHSSPFATYLNPYAPFAAAFPNAVSPAAAAVVATAGRKSSTLLGTVSSSSSARKKVILKKRKKTATAVKSSASSAPGRKSVSSAAAGGGRSITIGGAEGGGE